VPRELKEKQRYLPLLSSCRRGEEIYFFGGKRRTSGSHMAQPIRTRKGKLAGQGKQDALLGRVVQVKKPGGGNLLT